MNAPPDEPDYVLDAQVGFLLRKANQRHRSLFSHRLTELPVPTQFAAMATLRAEGPLTQNELGRQAAMDSATITGVINRLEKRGLIRTEPDPTDGRRRVVTLTGEGEAMLDRVLPQAAGVTEETLEPLTARERSQFLRLLKKLADAPH